MRLFVVAVVVVLAAVDRVGRFRVDVLILLSLLTAVLMMFFGIVTVNPALFDKYHNILTIF